MKIKFSAHGKGEYEGGGKTDNVWKIRPLSNRSPMQADCAENRCRSVDDSSELVDGINIS